MRVRARGFRWSRALVLASALVVAGAGIAWAHATLVRSDPASGARLIFPPRVLRLEFNEAVNATTSRVELVAPDSQRLSLAPHPDSADQRTLLAAVPSLGGAGVYRVEWRLVGPDGHAVTGRYTFTVDSIPVAALDSTPVRPAPAAMEDAHEPPVDARSQQVLRFLGFLGMVVVIGAIAFAIFVLPAGTASDGTASVAFRADVDRRLRSTCTIGAWSLLALAVVRLTSHGITLAGSLGALRVSDLVDLVTGSTFGRGWLLQVVAVVALLAGLRGRRPVRWPALGGAAAALAISAAFLGHPAAVPDVAGLAMGLDAIHVLAAGGWGGAILMLSVVALPQVASVPAGNRMAVARGLLRAFTPLALTCAAVLAITGAIGGWLQLRDLTLVLGSAYGLALFRKVVIVLGIVALGAYHWRVVQPTMASNRSLARLRLSLVLDAAFVLLVLVLTAVLTGTAPPVR